MRVASDSTRESQAVVVDPLIQFNVSLLHFLIASDSADALKGDRHRCEKFMLPLAKPMRTNATLFEQDALNSAPILICARWAAGVAYALAAAHSRAKMLDGSGDIVDGSLLPLLADYAPAQSFAQSSVAPLDRVPSESQRRRVREFANQHSVDVAAAAARWRVGGGGECQCERKSAREHEDGRLRFASSGVVVPHDLNQCQTLVLWHPCCFIYKR
jgi:hypothetical protein